jgi:predicted DNA-binding protein (MmcQ/YjbR family)
MAAALANVEDIREYCLRKLGVSESFPFGESTLVFKVGGKMFALLDVNSGSSINLKCDPERAVELRDRYPAVRPGYHQNKQHWNTIDLDGSISPSLLAKWIDDSYELVRTNLPKRVRDSLIAGEASA